jgi:colanic acid biosynthesis glycosyl transferase WcaI
MAARPRLLILNQYYWPGIEATAFLLTELSESLAAAGWDVTVVCGRAAGAEAGTSERNGVRVVRLRSTAFEKRFLALRGLNYLSFLVLAGLRGLSERGPDVVLAMTDPPFVGTVAAGLARRFRVPLLLVVQDVFPETAAAVGKLRSPLLRGIVGRVAGLGLQDADRVVAIGETMRRRLLAKGVDGRRIRVIPNWVDAQSIRPVLADNEWSRSNGLAGRFVVMHFGNLGFAHDLDTLVRAAALLPDDVCVAIVGRGAREEALKRLARELGARNVRFLPHQPRDLASLCISSATVHVVGLAPGLAGYVVPSRIYGVLAAGRPVIAAADDESETARLVRDAGCGVVVPPGDPGGLAAAIGAAWNGQYDLGAMGRRGRDHVVREASREVAVSRYRALLEEVQRSGS